VRVRLLLDDNGVAGLDDVLATLDAHPNIEVRLFNPFVNRRLRALGYLTDFDRLNRRMHNKSFTADAQASIVGGRNVGDEYFEAGDATTFADLDVLTFGPAAVQTGGVFDLYWNSDSAYPVALLLPAPAAGAAAGGAPLVVWTLADPGGTAAGGVLTLAWSAAAYAAAASGTAVWGRLMDSAGNWVLDAECGLLGSAAIFQLESLTVLAGALIQPTTSTITD
jgi:phosphatidylserine/phosphatidylglycerophosphate/cardiolipin synthase-like enzyme